MKAPSTNFAKWLAEGQKVEDIVLQRIQKKYPHAFIKEGYFPDYDIYIPEVELKIEVKSCPRCHEYNSVLIEFEMNDQQTALCISKADYWIIYDGKKFHCLTKGDILHCIFVNRLIYWEGYGDGDKVSKKAFKIPPDLLFKYSKEFI
jgi:hypothetical protein